MVEKPKIKIDIDNVMNNMVEAMLAMYNDRYNMDLKIEDCTRYDFSSYDEDVAIELRSYFGDPELFERMIPTRNAVQYLFKMYTEFDVKIVTSTAPCYLEQKIAWVKKWFPFIKDRDIISAECKEWIWADYVIDDCLAYLMRDGATRILIDRPWNRAVRDYIFGLQRVNDLKDAYEIINTLEVEMEKKYDQI